MSEVAIFSIGAIIFAITVYGAVMAGGLALTRAEFEDLGETVPEPADDVVRPGLPEPERD